MQLIHIIIPVTHVRAFIHMLLSAFSHTLDTRSICEGALQSSQDSHQCLDAQQVLLFLFFKFALQNALCSESAV